MSKVTADSGVVMDNREVLLLPGVLPRKPPPQTFACVGHVPPDGALVGLVSLSRDCPLLAAEFIVVSSAKRCRRLRFTAAGERHTGASKVQ